MPALAEPLMSPGEEGNRPCGKMMLPACAVAFAFGLGMGAERTFLAQPWSVWPQERSDLRPTSLDGGFDSHGCKTGEGYMWCRTLRRCVQEQVTPCPLPRVLVTGFLPFEGFKVNPAELVASHIGGSCTKFSCIESRVIPVNHVGAALPAQLLNDSWDGVIHLGFEDESKGLRLELIAANVEATEWGGAAWNENIPCNKSGTAWRNLDGDGPCLLASTAPLNGLELPLLPWGSSPREIWSRDAGAYYCNEVYYNTLRAVRGRLIQPASGQQDLLPVIFVHLPTLEVSTVAESGKFVQAIADRLSMQATCRLH